MNAEHVENLSGGTASAKIIELIKHARTCMMMTSLDKRPIPTRPMGFQKVDAQGRMYFFSPKDSDKNAEIAASNMIQIAVANDSDNEYVSLYGTAEIYRDQKEIDELYNALANNWFEGKDDPNITIIRFTPTDGHYWDSKHGKLVQFASMVIGAVTGKQGDDGLEGDLKP